VPALGLLAAAALTGHFLLGAEAATTTQTFNPVADSWVDQSAKSKNYGTGTNLRTDNSPVRKAYLRFNVQGLTAGVQQATLRLYATTASSAGYQVRALADNSWGERTITYNNAPPPSQTVTGSSGPIGSPQWTSVDVTGLVGGNGLVSLVLTTTSSTSMQVASREYGLTRAPQLVITTAAVPPTGTSPPTVSGQAQDGSILAAAPGSWSGTEPITHSYRWRRCDAAGAGCADIAGATAKTYTLTSADVASTIRVAVTASNVAGSGTASSEATAMVRPAAPTNSSRPTISGAARDESSLTAAPGSWSGTEPITYRYQWRRCDSGGNGCADIAGATASVYTLTSAEVESTIRVAVTASNVADSATATSDPTAVVAPAPTPPINSSPPTISGAALDRSALTAAPGTWSGTEPITHSYQWRRCDAAGAGCADIAGATASTYTLTSADVGSTVRVAVTASNVAGSSTESSEATAFVLAADPMIAAAGDIACDPTSSSFNGGLGSSSSCHQKATSDLLTGASLAAVLPLGDLQYENGTLAAFQQSYDLSWGRVKEITHPVPGNHEYHTTAAAGYFDYFNGTGNANGSAGNRSTGYYSFEVGAWHLIALNSNCSRVGGCGPGSPQEQWLRQDLAASTADCTLAYWHHPLFSSGTHTPGISSAKPLFQALYDHGADLVLTGHDHNYERFAPQDPNGALDLTRGLRQFVVGTGGKSHYAQITPVPNSEVRNSDTHGVLELTLHATGYEWRFAPESGKTFTDSGSDSCNGAAADGEAPTVPSNLTAAAPGSNLVELSWTAANDNVGVTGYEIHRNGALLTTTTSAVTSYSDGSVAGSTSYDYQVRARDAAGNVSAPSNSAAVTTPTGSAALGFAPEADARVQEANPSTNYGASYLRADGGSDPDVESHLRFSVSGISGAVQSAKLRVHAYTGTADGPAVYGTGNAWTETGVTWSSRPGRLGAATDDKGSIGTNTWVEYDVTPLVQGNGTYGFVLVTSSSDGVDIYSREANGLQPELMVTFGS
jgi:calcineurin-like phosphoesterase family protein